MRLFSFTLLLLISFGILSQNESINWVFGAHTGLKFSSGSPVSLNGFALNLNGTNGPACISDTQGSLMFYSNGDTVWNASNLILSNGTGLSGSSSGSQSKLVLKKPQSNSVYYFFYINASPGSPGLYYSIIDMSLAGGSGSVTAKNVPLYTGQVMSAITGCRHCNGSDYWLVMHELSNNTFRSFVLSNTGINTTPVVSSIGTNTLYGGASMKLNAQGTKLGLINSIPPTGLSVNFFDFNRSTGTILNFNSFGNTFTGGGSQGCEFSPDGSKFYFAEQGAPKIHQLNLCASNTTAIVATDFTITASGIPFSFKLAPNGKIYITNTAFQSKLGVINFPNQAGASMSYIDQGLDISPQVSGWCLPNFISSQTGELIQFNQGLACLSTQFTALSSSNASLTSCWSTGNPVIGVLWNFGDPLSGPLNTSTLSAPSHTFSAFGTYTVKLAMSYSSCAADTMQQVISIVQASANVLTSSVACNSMASASVQVLGGSGNYSYTWTPSAQNGSVAYALSGGVYTLSVQDASFNCSQNFSTSINVPTLNIIAVVQSTPYCGFSNANVSVFNGSGNYSYQWLPGNQNSPSLNNLSAGNYTVLVFDPLNNCNLSSSLQVVPLALPVLSLSPSASICPGQSHTLTVAGADLYLWSTGSSSASIVVNPMSTSYYSVSGTLSSSGCSVSKTLTLTVVPCLAIVEHRNIQNEPQVYPNPCSGWIWVNTLTDQKMTLFNVTGNLVFETTLKAGSSQLNLEVFPEGLYFLHLSAPGNRQVFRIIKARN
ncbi:MAG TPA: T9SS type A sorting domain-containing protein [Bacteroidia bacterium]|nr:T9SS type A sorting domain-containing protein [Bacteroidia bacterium]